MAKKDVQSLVPPSLESISDELAPLLPKSPTIEDVTAAVMLLSAQQHAPKDTKGLPSFPGIIKYSEDQPREPNGEFGSGGGSSSPTDLTQNSAFMSSLGRQYEDTSAKSAIYDYRNGDNGLAQIYEKQGFNTAPQVLSGAKFDKAAAESPVGTVYRGVSDTQYVNDYTNGSTHFAGLGIMGNGTYTTSNLGMAQNYATTADPGSTDSRVITMALSPGANIVDYTTLANSNAELYNSLKDTASNATSADEKQAALGQIGLINDLGRQAALQGYDAIKVGDTGTVVVLNRGATIVKGN